jgi:hypothetical protein
VLTIKDGSFLDPAFGERDVQGLGVNTEAGVTVLPRRASDQRGIPLSRHVVHRRDRVSTKDYELRPRFREDERQRRHLGPVHVLVVP